MRRPALFLKYNTDIFMTEQELREIFQLLEAQGLRPQLCDTPVPYYEEAAPCVIPSEMGDTVERGIFSASARPCVWRYHDDHPCQWRLDDRGRH